MASEDRSHSGRTLYTSALATTSQTVALMRWSAFHCRTSRQLLKDWRAARNRVSVRCALSLTGSLRCGSCEQESAKCLRSQQGSVQLMFAGMQAPPPDRLDSRKSLFLMSATSGHLFSPPPANFDLRRQPTAPATTRLNVRSGIDTRNRSAQ